ncbi:hypothetical protein [Streptomyces sp. NPDC006463]
MQHPAGVCRAQPGEHVHGDPAGPLHGQRLPAPGDQLGQVLTVERH